jgi:hypothetical protein
MDLLADTSMIVTYLSELRRLYEADAGVLQLTCENTGFDDDDVNDESGLADEPEITISRLLQSSPLLEAATAAAAAATPVSIAVSSAQPTPGTSKRSSSKTASTAGPASKRGHHSRK